MEKIKVGIIGYGNIGKGVEFAIGENPDMKLETIFTRRDSKSIVPESSNANVANIHDAHNYIDKIDVMILCGGSAKDLPRQTPRFAELFNTVDSFDTHAKISDYFNAVNKKAIENNHISIVSVGWDPGLFSMNRLLAESVLPNGQFYTFWGPGVSQGHSNAIRGIKGVKYGIEYTVPIKNALERIRLGSDIKLTDREMHLRQCYVVAENGEDLPRIEREIKGIPNYFLDYDTSVYFIDEEEFKKNHSKMPHGGFVIHRGKTGKDSTNHTIEFSLKLESNPEFTANVLVAYARAAVRMHKEGLKGAKTVFDVPLSYLSSKDSKDIREELL